MLAAALTVAAIPSATSVLDACARAHARLDSGAFAVSVRTDFGGSVAPSRFEVLYSRPDTIKVRVVEAQSGVQRGSDRTYALIGGNLLGYDADANERISRRSRNSGNLVERLEVAIGPVDESVAVWLDSGSMGRFLGQFRAMPGWNVSETRDRIKISRRIRVRGRASMSTFSFSRSTKLLLSADLSADSKRLVWTYEHAATPKRIAWSPPSGAVLVPSFTVRPELPKGVESAARPILDRAVRAYSRLRNLYVAVQDGRNQATIWKSDGRARQETARARWAYDGGTLAIELGATRRFYRGKLSAGRVLPTLNRLKVELDGTLVQLLQRINPVLGVLTPEAQVRLAGSIVLDGVACDLLEVRGKLTKASLIVRRSDGLLARISLERQDTKGQRAFRSERAFRYASVGKPLSSDLFRISPKAGFRVYPLPKF